MPAPVPLPIRKSLWAGSQQGQSATELANQFGLSVRTVRNLLKTIRDTGGEVQPAGYKRDGMSPIYPQNLLDRVRAMKQMHPVWGAGFISEILSLDFPDTDLPCVRTIQNWVRDLDLPKAPPGRPRLNYQRAGQVHQRWQMDAAEQMKLSDGSWLCWLRVTDEHSGAVLGTQPYPRSHFCSVPPVSVQDQMRQWFAIWGMPDEFRLDNGWPWACGSEFPTAFELWLAGLGVSCLFNNPGRPEHNGVVERSHGTLQRWADFQECPNFQELEQRVGRADLIQRERYPSVAGKSRMEVFPELRSKRREYSREWEEEKWDLEKAKRLLETHAGYRKVMSKGQVKVYKRRIQVGQQHKGKMALIRYDAASGHWTVSFDDDVTRCVPATEINRLNITTLAICDGDDVKRQTQLPD